MSTGSGTASRDVNAIAPLAPNAWLRYDLVERMLPAGVTDVLEIGCGRGAFGVRLAARHNYLGVEPDLESCQVARQRVAAAGRGEVRNIAVEDLGTAQFDLVCAFEVLEHIEDDAAAVKEWLSRVRPGGWLLLSVPADQHRFNAFDKLVGHFRRYDPDVMTALLASAGLSSISVRRYGYPLNSVTEAARVMVGKRRLARAETAATTVSERTAGSGRVMQPGEGVTGVATRLGTAPFRRLQRMFPDKGVGLVALGHLNA
ncbi:MAG TPA: class I SAM-dependent methyltransferase [Trebonia sp.]|jgi:SAM-dependent methyltransferase|nr:class I SAM-dependent methyltransferase [Trebonia sp.]